MPGPVDDAHAAAAEHPLHLVARDPRQVGARCQAPGRRRRAPASGTARSSSGLDGTHLPPAPADLRQQLGASAADLFRGTPGVEISSSSCSTRDSSAMAGLLEAAACRDSDTQRTHSLAVWTSQRMCWLAKAKNCLTVWGRASRMALSSRSATAPSNSSACKFIGGCVRARIAPVQQGGAQQVEPADGPVKQGVDDRLGGRIPRQLVQVALDRGGCVFLGHRANHRLKGRYIRHQILLRQVVCTATLSIMTGKEASR